MERRDFLKKAGVGVAVVGSGVVALSAQSIAKESSLSDKEEFWADVECAIDYYVDNGGAGGTPKSPRKPLLLTISDQQHIGRADEEMLMWEQNNTACLYRYYPDEARLRLLEASKIHGTRSYPEDNLHPQRVTRQSEVFFRIRVFTGSIRPYTFLLFDPMLEEPQNG